MAVLLLTTLLTVPVAVQAESQGASLSAAGETLSCHRRTDVTWARCQVIDSWADTNEAYWACFDESNDPDGDGPVIGLVDSLC